MAFHIIWLTRICQEEESFEAFKMQGVSKWKKHWQKLKHGRSEMHLKLLDFKVNLIFMEKYVGRLSCAYLKYIGRN